MEKLKGVLAYLFGWIVGLIVFFTSEGDTKFHGAQAIMLDIIAVVGGIVLGILALIFGFILVTFSSISGLGVIWVILTFAFAIYILILKISGIIKVLTGKGPEVALVGNLTHSIFKI